jgi:prepilin-type N-terminal cleavage/methylation domain-containing protein
MRGKPVISNTRRKELHGTHSGAARLLPPHSARVVSSQQTGFTLVELSVVVLLIVVLAALTAPAFAGFWRASRVRTCAWQIATLARRARDYSICRGMRTSLEYDSEQREFRLTAESDPTNAPGEFEQLMLAGAQPVKVPDEVEVADFTVEGKAADQGWPVMFFPDGQALEARIVLDAQPDTFFSVEISPLIGQAKVVEGDVRAKE